MMDAYKIDALMCRGSAHFGQKYVRESKVPQGIDLRKSYMLEENSEISRTKVWKYEN